VKSQCMSVTSKTTSINWAVICSQTKANRDLGIYTTKVSQINMAYIPSLFILLMENTDSTRMCVCVCVYVCVCIYIYIYKVL